MPLSKVKALSAEWFRAKRGESSKEGRIEEECKAIFTGVNDPLQ